MGKKIPGKKHRKIKDPYKQKQKRFESLQFKVDNPPTSADVQEIPKSLLKIIELKNKAKEVITHKPKKRNKKSGRLSVAEFIDKETFQKGMTKPDRYIPNLIQKPNESAESFLKRLNIMTQHMINEVEFEKKFKVEIKKNSETGEVLEVKSLSKKRKTSKKKKLAEKKKAKLNVKRESLKSAKDFSQLRDNIKFGEVVHKPPDLVKVKRENENQKHKFSNLLLNNVFNNVQSELKNSKSDLLKEKAENERKFIVESYRKLKRKNFI